MPPAIRRQAERAEQLQRESIGQPPQNGQDGPPVTPGVTEPVSPQTPPAAAPAPAAPPPAASELATVQGRLDRERERRVELETQVASLNRMVAELQEKTRTPPPPPPPSARARLVTPEEEADYGKDLLEVVGRKAREETSGEIETLKDEIKKLNNQLAQVGQRVWQRDTGDLHTQLTQSVPNWLELNTDEHFIQWLQQPEPFSGLKRHDLLTKAYDLQDAGRVIRFFQGYLDEAAATGQRLPATPNSVPPHNGANGKVPLETFAAPGRAAPAPASAPPGQKPTYTRAGIAQFYTDKAAGKWRGREAEAAQIEADLFRAGPEGRVIG